jgi:hypothetical protein
VRRLLPAALLVLAAAEPVLAADEDKNIVGFFLLSVTLIPLALVPLGLAFHLLFRALAPRRTRQLADAVETRGTLALVLGFVNFLVLALIFVAAQHHAPGVAGTAYLVFVLLAALGSHGIACSLGARVLGSPAPGTGLRELAVGWFVMSYVSWFPIVGWCFGLYWAFRGTGALILSVFAPEASGEDDAPLAAS